MKEKEQGKEKFEGFKLKNGTLLREDSGDKSDKDSSWAGTIFDDVLRTIQERHPALLIPLVNEIFGTNYPASTPVTRLPEGYQKLVSKVVADSCNVIARHVYHIECQSTSDGRMIIRMVEYDFMVGRSMVRRENGEYVFRFPKSCIVYLRGKANRKKDRQHFDDGKKGCDNLRIVFADGKEVDYKVPVAYIQEYSLEEIFEKRLYVYLPYYILRYENDLKRIEKGEGCNNKFKETFKEELLGEYRKIVDFLGQALSDDAMLYQDMLRLIRRVMDYVLRKTDEINEEVGEIMGGRVLELPSDKLREEYARGMGDGISQGEDLHLISLIQKKMKKNKSVETIADELETDMEEILPIYQKIETLGVDCKPEKVLETMKP